MKQIFASFYKEWLLLWRDKVGLIFLFILPMCLVLFITLTETEDPDKPRQLKVLLLNQDNSDTLKTVVNEVKKIEGFNVTQISENNQNNIAELEEQVAKGHYQVLIIIPSTANQDISRYVQNMTGSGTNISNSTSNPIHIIVDPTLPKNLQDQIQLSLQYLVKNIETNILKTVLSNSSTGNLNPRSNKDILTVTVDPAKIEGQIIVPNAVQQNVPAWALFGMFFIITPLSGVLVKERMLGVMNRLFIAPASFAYLILGKVFAFVLLNLVQLALMLAVGVFILPLFGLPALNIDGHLAQIILIGICASLAATGFGMLVGSLVRTPEQANVIGPFVIVIAAAMGGIFIPIYLLPESMQQLSNYSPMHWAHAAFLDVFIRHAGFEELWPNLAKLIGLFIVTTWLALLKITYRSN